jgi:heme/copper-type cytochrome/quinol oxidase subunit 2
MRLRRLHFGSIVLPSLTSVVALLPFMAFGQTTLQNPITSTHLYCFLHDVLGAFILIVFPVVVLALVYSGFLFVSAQGNHTKIEEARKWFFWVVVGGLIILGAQALTWAIEATVNDILQTSGVGTPINTNRNVCQ